MNTAIVILTLLRTHERCVFFEISMPVLFEYKHPLECLQSYESCSQTNESNFSVFCVISDSLAALHRSSNINNQQTVFKVK